MRNKAFKHILKHTIVHSEHYCLCQYLSNAHKYDMASILLASWGVNHLITPFKGQSFLHPDHALQLAPNLLYGIALNFQTRKVPRPTLAISHSRY